MVHAQCPEKVYRFGVHNLIGTEKMLKIRSDVAEVRVKVDDSKFGIRSNKTRFLKDYCVSRIVQIFQKFVCIGFRRRLQEITSADISLTFELCSRNDEAFCRITSSDKIQTILSRIFSSDGLLCFLCQICRVQILKQYICFLLFGIIFIFVPYLYDNKSNHIQIIGHHNS